MKKWPLATAQRVIIIAGCLAMAYTQLTMSPATVEFARAHGGSGLHVGILGALPTLTIFMQFVAAVLVNHLSFRRPVWFWVSLLQRLVLVPVGLGPLCCPEAPDAVWVWMLIALTALNHGLLHFGSPLWLSWMGDYLPHEGLSQFWGQRHFWMQWTAALSLLGGALILRGTGWGIDAAFAALTLLAAAAGVCDILLFGKVEEPPVQPLPQPTLARVFAAPFRDQQFRTFISYTCFWHFAAMLGAPFISLYLLDYLGMSLPRVLLLWAASWAGGALLSRRIGLWIEAHGNRPMLILCTIAKPIGMLALLLVPLVPAYAFLILVPVFVIDALLNAGIAVATNGFMLKYSPRENRSMFIAASTALAGMVGGLTAIAAGWILAVLEEPLGHWQGLPIVGFHVLFASSLVCRMVAVVLAWAVYEPQACGTRQVMTELIGATPLRILRFPLGLYRNFDVDVASSRLAVPSPVSEPTPAEQTRRRAA